MYTMYSEDYLMNVIALSPFTSFYFTSNQRKGKKCPPRARLAARLVHEKVKAMFSNFTINAHPMAIMVPCRETRPITLCFVYHLYMYIYIYIYIATLIDM